MRVTVFNYGGNPTGDWIVGVLEDDQLRGGTNLVVRLSGSPRYVPPAFDGSSWQISMEGIQLVMRSRYHNLCLKMEPQTTRELEVLQYRSVIQRTVMGDAGRRSYLFFLSSENDVIPRRA